MNRTPRVLSFGAILAVLALAGCKDTHDVAYWKAHPAELKKQLAKCHDNPGELEHTPNCVNAQKASTDMLLGTHSNNMAHF